jgi:uncharacterized surface protein with fasciclin (FAS1) repeats
MATTQNFGLDLTRPGAGNTPPTSPKLVLTLPFEPVQQPMRSPVNTPVKTPVKQAIKTPWADAGTPKITQRIGTSPLWEPMVATPTCPPQMSPQVSMPTIMEYLRSHKDYSILVELITKAGLAETIDSNLYTLFAPTNEAFQDAAAMLKVPNLDLARLLSNHLLKGLNPMSMVFCNGDMYVYTVRNKRLKLSTHERNFVIDYDDMNGPQQAQVLLPDIILKTGAINVISRVLL